MKTIVYFLLSSILMVSAFSCKMDDNLQNGSDEFVNNVLTNTTQTAILLN